MYEESETHFLVLRNLAQEVTVAIPELVLHESSWQILSITITSLEVLEMCVPKVSIKSEFNILNKAEAR